MRWHILSGLPFFLLFGSISAHSQYRYEAYLPHIANGSFGGGSFKTSFLFLNTQSVPANVNLLLRESVGAPFKVNLTGQGTGSDFNFRLEPNGLAIFQTDGSGPLAAGAALINSDVPIGASGIFSVFDAQGRFQTEAGVGADTPIWGITLPVDTTGKFDTGVAIFNAYDTGRGQLTLRLWTEDGEAKGESRMGQ